MPQLSLYINELLETRLKMAALARKTSVSKLVSEILEHEIGGTYDEDFVGLYGSTDWLERPQPLVFADDLQRDNTV